ncbi:hypothetical protein ACSBR1_007020 [Camellia fascicularis]
MNQGGGGGGGGGSGNNGRKKIFGTLPNNGRKDRRDEEEVLLLFREMHKQEKDRTVSLLQPVSDEFEANGNYPLYRMASVKKGSGGGGDEFLADQTGKMITTVLSDQAPPNLRTERSSSASRGRYENQTLANIHQKTEPVPKTRRQSCSPSVTRGRKVEPKPENTSTTGAITTATATTITETATTISQKGRTQLAGNGTQILGSRMVDKFMNARKSIAEERETKLKFHGSINESSGFGRTMMSKSSLGMALKHMDVKRDPANFHRASTNSGRHHAVSSTPSSYSPSEAA